MISQFLKVNVLPEGRNKQMDCTLVIVWWFRREDPPHHVPKEAKNQHP